VSICTSNTRGTVSLVALCFVAVLGIVLASYIAVCSRAMNLSNRSFQSNLGRQLAEFGLEEGSRAFNNNDWGSWSSTPAKMDSGAWTFDQAYKRATRTISFNSGKLGQGMTATVKIRVDNYDFTQLSSTWTSGKTYRENDLVGHGGIWYRCLTTHSGQQPPNLNYWADEGLNWAWNSSQNYVPGDLVNVSGIWYRCKTTHSNQQPPKASYWVPVSSIYNTAPGTYPAEGILRSGSSWARLSNSPPWTWEGTTPIAWRWETGITYAFGDVISDPAQTALAWKRCILANTSDWYPNTYSNSSLWRSVTSFWTWDTNVSYNPSDVVYRNGSWYRALKTNSGQTPSSSSNVWSNAPLFSPQWSSGKQYNQYDTVVYNGVWYLCLQNNIYNVNPTHTTAASGKWVAATNAGSTYTWSSSKNYLVDDPVAYNGAWYRCRKTNNNGISPNNAEYWTSAWANSFGVTTGTPIIYVECVLTLGDNTTSTTQLRSIIAPAPLFPNAVGASSTISINTGAFDSYDSKADVYNGSNNGSANIGTAAVIAAGTSLTITGSSSIKGYLAAPTLPANISATTTLNGNAFSFDKSRATRSTNIPRFAIRDVAGATTLTNLGTIGTPGATTPSVYSYQGDLELTSTLTIAGPVILDIKGQLRIRTGGQIVVAATGSVEIHATRIRIGGNGVDNKTLDPLRCVILCTGTTNTHTFSTTQKFHGVIYLPDEDLDFTGTSMELFGAVSARSLTFSNSTTFHYDTSLRYSSIPGVDQPYTVVDWRELPASERATMQ
jgi:hypothetical protein